MKMNAEHLALCFKNWNPSLLKGSLPFGKLRVGISENTIPPSSPQ